MLTINKIKNNFRIVLILSAFLSFQSCITRNNIAYLQNDLNEKYETKLTTYRLQPNDYVYVRLFSQDKDINELLNFGGQTQMTGNQSENLFQFMVSDQGYVDIPQLDSVFVLNKTIDEAKAEVQKVLDASYSDSRVDVRLARFNFTILGEVEQAGTFTINANRISIIEAIATAGDFSTFADRKNVKIVRQEPDGKKVYLIDVTSADILSSDFYYLQPNDFIYVEPLKSAYLNTSYYPVLSFASVILATTSAILVFIGLFNKN